VILDTGAIESRIRGGESLTVEFKSERRESLSDHEIFEAVVCLANAKGGVLLIGVENDGAVTGARARHGGSTDPYRLQATIFNSTVPPINTRVSVHEVDERSVLAIEVDRYPEICATKDGKCVRRVRGVRGPECLPFYPHEHGGRRGDLGLVDHSAQAVEGATTSDLDRLEIERLRQTIERRRGDRALLTLDDQELLQALRLVESRGKELVPNVAGLLMVGREATLRRVLPTHEVAFQVLDTQGNVSVNDWFYGPRSRHWKRLRSGSAREIRNERCSRGWCDCQFRITRRKHFAKH
jgi:ATP-dependent DNA helicase RecG